ncbi:MAG: glycosyltransferase [Chloroflexota bacterium]
MNILYICADRGIPIRGHKGAAVHVRTLSDAFTRAGHTVTIMTPRSGPADGPAPLAEIVEVPLPTRPLSLDEDPATHADRRAVEYADYLTEVALDWITKNPCDMIYERYSLWSDVGARLSRLLRLPLVLEVNAPLREEAARYRTVSDEARAAKIESAQFSVAHSLSVVSQGVAEYVIQHGAHPAHVHVLPNGVDPTQFYPGIDGKPLRERYGLQEKHVVGFVGSPRPWHDLTTLLRAVAQLRKQDARYHLLLVGKMPDDIQEMVARLELQAGVTMTGAVPHTAVPHHIAAMDVAVSPHPALGDFYFSPLKLYEYLACGVPTVAANIGQPGKLIQHGKNGRLYEPENAKQLAEQIADLIKNPHHRSKIAWAGASMVLQNHTWDKNAATVASWIRPKAKPANTDPAHFTFPMYDDRLRHKLYQATRTDLLRSALAEWLPLSEGALEIEVLKYKPERRCIVAYRANGETIIGKVFKDQRGVRLLRLQEALYQRGFGLAAADQIYVAEPLGYVPDMNLMLQACAPGQTLNELAEAGSITPWIDRCAETLAKLHRTAVPAATNGASGWGLKPYLLTDELENLAKFRDEICERLPEENGRIQKLFATLERWARFLPPLPQPTTIHRDFYYSQLIMDGAAVTLIDFDLIATGDPAIDVANFIAHLYFLGGELRQDWTAFASDAHLFWESYQRYGMMDATFEERLDFYRAATFFRLLNVTSSRPHMAHLYETVYTLTTAALELS